MPMDDLLPAAEEPGPEANPDMSLHADAALADTMDREAQRAAELQRQMEAELVDDTELRPLRFRGLLVQSESVCTELSCFRE